MNGSTMIARIRPEVMMPMPYGGPANSVENTGTLPKTEIRNGCSVCCKNGANMKKPQMP